MLFAADLHLHSRFASGVSPAMTLENIALWAQRKGVDLLGTGDCLQPQWLAEIEDNLIDAEPGFLALKPEIEKAVQARLPAGLRRSLRFVLSTEVNCVPPGREEMRGIHQLLYFPSLAVVKEFAARIAKKGDLQEGRPTLALSVQHLVRGARDFDRVHVAAPHVMNPWFSVLGVVGGAKSIEAIYGEDSSGLLAVETGLTSNRDMCRRIPCLDPFGLYSCSDAHSLDNIGRECTLLDIEPHYNALMAALKRGTTAGVRGTLKFPLGLTRYYPNWCSHCQEAFPVWPLCPECRKQLTMGSHDRLPLLEKARAVPVSTDAAPPFETLRPLAYVIADHEGKSPDTVGVRRACREIVETSGLHERALLTEADAAELLSVMNPEVADRILRQRKGPPCRLPKLGSKPLGQATLWE